MLWGVWFSALDVGRSLYSTVQFKNLLTPYVPTTSILKVTPLWGLEHGWTFIFWFCTHYIDLIHTCIPFRFSSNLHFAQQTNTKVTGAEQRDSFLYLLWAIWKAHILNSTIVDNTCCWLGMTKVITQGSRIVNSMLQSPESQNERE